MQSVARHEEESAKKQTEFRSQVCGLKRSLPLTAVAAALARHSRQNETARWAASRDHEQSRSALTALFYMQRAKVKTNTRLFLAR